VAGFIAAVNREHVLGEVINIGSNFEISVGETAKMIADLMGVEVDIVMDDQRLRPSKSEVERLWADTTKARKLLNHDPEYAGRDGLRRGLARTIEWFTLPANLKWYKTRLYNI
jgi:dTDP-glucose 4,6-dehydratase